MGLAWSERYGFTLKVKVRANTRKKSWDLAGTLQSTLEVEVAARKVCECDGGVASLAVADCGVSKVAERSGAASRALTKWVRT